MNNEFWNERYLQHATVYGDEPNEFFKTQIDLLTPGTLFLPAEGEGRNGLYAASRGWNVQACDFSEVAKEKAMARATSLGFTSFMYTIQNLSKIELPENQFDAVAIIYVHLPEAIRKHLHQQCIKSVKPGGKILFEAFGEEQLQYTSGGPKDVALLHSLSNIHTDFASLEINYAEELHTSLREGQFHSGAAHVVRMVATKR